MDSLLLCKPPLSSDKILETIDKIKSMEKCKTEHEWNKVIPHHDIRSIIFCIYINTNSLEYHNKDLVSTHRFLHGNNTSDEDCKGCWICCSPLTSIDYHKEYVSEGIQFVDSEGDDF